MTRSPMLKQSLHCTLRSSFFVMCFILNSFLVSLDSNVIVQVVCGLGSIIVTTCRISCTLVFHCCLMYENEKCISGSTKMKRVTGNKT